MGKLEEINGDEFLGIVANNSVVIVDVRREEELCITGVIKNAKWCLLTDLDKQDPSLGDKNTPIIAYCAGGVRSLAAARMLVEYGYQQVYSLRGGINAWLSEGKLTVPYDFDG